VITPLDVMVFAWLIVMMGASIAAHLFALGQSPPEARIERQFDWVTVAFGLIYIGGYALVATGIWPILSWSRWFQGVSLVAVPVIWVLPAWRRGLTWKANRAAAAQIVALAQEQRSR